MAKERKWIVKEPADPEKVGRLSAELGIDRVLSELLVKRGVETFEQARSFFRPSLDNLHDPFLMKDMDAAVERVRKAITSEEKILVYGDYDVDGTTAVALVYSFLKRYSQNVDFNGLSDFTRFGSSYFSGIRCHSGVNTPFSARGCEVRER